MSKCRYGKVLFWKPEFGLGQIQEDDTGAKFTFGVSGRRNAERSEVALSLTSGACYVGPKWLQLERREIPVRRPKDGDRVVFDPDIYGSPEDPVWDFMDP
ncbi:MAG TPA: hypothetical protein VGE35_03045 [Candidatus Paceibacterota bacterium]